MQVLAAHREALGPRRPAAAARAAPAEQVGEDVRQVDVLEAAARVVGRLRPLGVFPVEPPLRPLLAAGVDLAPVEAAALIGVLQQVVGRRGRLERAPRPSGRRG